jgi:hypothetical protein
LYQTAISCAMTGILLFHDREGIITIMKGLTLCRNYFQSVGLPMLEQEFPSDLNRIAAGLVGDGSECFGFDDDISQDHDWGPGFCLWLTPEDHRRIGDKLQDAYNNLPAVFQRYGPRQTSAWGDGRVGVFEIEAFYQRFIGLDRPPATNDQWLALPETALAACTNGEVFHDPLGRFTAFRQALEFYPDDVRLKKIAARLMSLGQSGQYNVPRCLKRAERFGAHYALTKFASDFISVVFLLNRRYMPFYKWMHPAVRELEIMGRWTYSQIAALIEPGDLENKVDRIERMSTVLIVELQRQGLTNGKSDFLVDHGPEVQARIIDPALRERNVWVG